MRRVPPHLVLIAALAVAAPASAEPDATPTVADQSGPAQFFLLSFNDAPLAEVVDGVVVSGLAQEVEIDPAATGEISFTAEGWYTPDALLRELGSSLMDRDLALVREADGGLRVILEANLARDVAAGAAVLAVHAAPLPSVGPSAGADKGYRPVRYGERRPDPWGYLLAFLAGMGAMGAGVWARPRLAGWARRLRRLPEPAPVLQISFQPQPVVEERVDPELVMPDRPGRTAV